MKDIIKQIRIAYKSQAYYPALFLALALPDICGALESENRIIFLEPNDRYKFDDNIINEVLNIDLINFCENICKGVENWLDDKIENKIIQQNIKKLIKKYPNGIFPYIMGIPVIG